MRGRRNPQATMLVFVDLDDRVPPDHPLRIVKQVADDVLVRMPYDFDRIHSKIGRAAISPERLLEAILLISLSRYGLRRPSARSLTTICSTDASWTWI